MNWPLANLAAALQERLRHERRIAVFSDFDGTLAALVPHPEDAKLLRGARQALLQLATCPQVVPAILSGRGLEDLQQRVKIPGLVLAGNHGLEIQGRGLNFQQPDALRLRPQLLALRDSLREKLQGFVGVAVEDKGLTATVHLRHVSPDHRDHAAEIVFRTAEREAPNLCIRHGLLSLEIRPALDWDKGAAARWILAQEGIPSHAAVCLGDDLTDEDLFSALPLAINVKVGLSGKTAARWRLGGPEETTELLEWLARYAPTLLSKNGNQT